jgi:hypothetical protein
VAECSGTKAQLAAPRGGEVAVACLVEPVRDMFAAIIFRAGRHVDRSTMIAAHLGAIAA